MHARVQVAGMTKAAQCGPGSQPILVAVDTAGNKHSATRCQCSEGMYGYSIAEGVERVAQLSDNQTCELNDNETSKLFCARCPPGVLCTDPGTEVRVSLKPPGITHFLWFEAER